MCKESLEQSVDQGSQSNFTLGFSLMGAIAFKVRRIMREDERRLPTPPGP